MTDGDLVRQTLAGRTGAYEELVRRWAPCVLAVCRARVGRREVAEELAQEALLRAFHKLPSLADPSRFGPWLHSIAVRACLDWRKARGRSEVCFSALDCDPEEFAEAGPPSGISDLERADEMGKLITLVAELPEEYREVLLLFYYQERTYLDIARMLGVSPATVGSRLAKARALLRERFCRCGR
jgi:RNA polymerase sigma-70 factor (ECF subfamily)